MEGTTPEGTAPATPRGLMLGATTAILAVAVGLAVLIGRQTPQYEAQARLTYEVAQQQPVVDQPAVLPSGAGAATTVANRALEGGSLVQLAVDSGLYAKLQMTGPERAGMLRSHLRLSEPQAGTLQLTFRDTNQGKASVVANGIAALLANYEVAVSAPAAVPLAAPLAPVTTDPPKSAPVTVAKPSSGLMGTGSMGAMTGVSHPPGEGSGRHRGERKAKAAHERVDTAHQETQAGGAREIADLTQQVKRVDGALENLAEVQSELKAEEGQVQAKLAALAKTEQPQAAAGAPSSAMQVLIQEKQRVDSDVSRNRAAVAGEQQHRTELESQMEQARTAKKAASQKTDSEETGAAAGPADTDAIPPAAAAAAAAVPAPLAAQNVAAAASQGSDTASGAVVGGVSGSGDAPQKITPFRVVEKAGPAVLVGRSRAMLWMWLGIATAVLLAVCLVPIVPAHYVGAPSETSDQERFGGF